MSLGVVFGGFILVSVVSDRWLNPKDLLLRKHLYG
jgi:hypothetical protein